MAELLKNQINEDFIKKFAGLISQVHSSFPQKKFISQVLSPEWKTFELKQRIRHVNLCLGKTLNLPYEEQISVLKKVVPQVNGLRGMIFPDFVEVYGFENPKVSKPALKYFTPFFSSEFAIRPFIKKDPQGMMKTLLAWTQDKDEHVRRLATEGCRPKLPWSFPLKDFQKDPSLVIAILEQLKNDTSLYVRKSVANNLNDISKDHPDLVLKLARKWIGSSENTDWILKHGLRTLLKTGNAQALALFGFSQAKNIKVSDLKLKQKKFTIGSHLEFYLKVENQNSKDVTLRIEYAIHYLTKNKKPSRKVFKLSEKIYSKGTHEIKRRHSLAQMTTRKHYPGTHSLEIILNGQSQIIQKFEIVEA